MGRSIVNEANEQSDEEVTDENENEAEPETEPDPSGPELVGAEDRGRRRVSARLSEENARIVTAAHIHYAEQSIGEVSINDVFNQIISEWGEQSEIDPDEVLESDER